MNCDLDWNMECVVDNKIDYDMVDNMLNDAVIYNAYHEFFKSNEDLFKDKIVLDVGCRSGMLSLMAVEVGAIKVIALGNMESAKFVQKALAGDEKEDIFESIDGSINNIRLPCGLKKVDIIVSEWMGHAIFTESLFRDVIYARDKWLVKGGLIIPNAAKLYIAGISNHHRYTIDVLSEDENDEIYVDEEPAILMEDHVNPNQLMTHRFRLKTLNLNVAKYEDEFVQASFNLTTLRDGEIWGFVIHFDVGFINSKTKVTLFSIGPRAPKTHLKQTILFPDQVLKVKNQDIVKGHIAMIANELEHRGVEFYLGIKSNENQPLST